MMVHSNDLFKLCNFKKGMHISHLQCTHASIQYYITF